MLEFLIGLVAGIVLLGVFVLLQWTDVERKAGKAREHLREASYLLNNGRITSTTLNSVEMHIDAAATYVKRIVD